MRSTRWKVFTSWKVFGTAWFLQRSQMPAARWKSASQSAWEPALAVQHLRKLIPFPDKPTATSLPIDTTPPCDGSTRLTPNGSTHPSYGCLWRAQTSDYYRYAIVACNLVTTCVVVISVSALMTYVINDLCGQWPAWSMTCVVDDLCGWWPVWSMTCVVDDLCGWWPVWSTTCLGQRLPGPRWWITEDWLNTRSKK